MHDAQPEIRRSRDGEALYRACEREGCPVCLVTLERMARVMDFWQYEWVITSVDLDFRKMKKDYICWKMTPEEWEKEE